MFIILCLTSFFFGAGLAILGLVLWGIFDIDAGEAIGKIGLVMMIIPVAILLFAGAIALLLSCLGLAILF